MKRRLRIGFLHRFDAQSLTSWSGTFHFMAKALEAHAGEVVYLGPDRSRATQFLIDNADRLNRLLYKMTGRQWATDHNRVLSWRLASFFEHRLREDPCDILFAPAASIEIACLKTPTPIVYTSDVTWGDIIDYYPQYSSLAPFARAEGHDLESRAIQRASAALFPSEWAADGARRHHHAPEATTFVLAFGANLDLVPTRAEALHHPLTSPLKLLFVGVDWERKGGAIALACLLALLDRGIEAHLTICGCQPPEGVSHPAMHCVGFLKKSDPQQQAELSRLYLDAHFLLFPTRAEALGVVACEAGAHGLPTLVSDTGGTRGSIREGVNGFLLPLAAGGSAYAAKIAETLHDPGAYDRLVAGSRDEYETRLNWDTWGRSVSRIMQAILQPGNAPGHIAATPHAASDTAEEHRQEALTDVR